MRIGNIVVRQGGLDSDSVCDLDLATREYYGQVLLHEKHNYALTVGVSRN